MDCKPTEEPVQHWSVLNMDMNCCSARNLITIVIDGQEYVCQKLVLYCHTNFFRPSLHLQRIELPLANVAPKAFHFIYNWMLIQDPPIPSRDCIIHVFRAATYLRVLPIIAQCWQYFNNPGYYTEHDAILMQVEAKLLGIMELTPTLFRCISKSFLPFVAGDNFVSLSISDVCLLLSSSNIGVNTELEVLMCIGYWLSHDLMHRRGNIHRLINCVRFNLLPIAYLSSFCLRQPIDWITHLLCTERSQRLACEIARDIINPCCNLCESWRNQRRWIFDERCAHHHRDLPIDPTQLSYDQFVAYLDELRQRDMLAYMKFEYKPKLRFDHPMLGSAMFQIVEIADFTDTTDTDSDGNNDDAL